MKYRHEIVELTKEVPAKILHQRFYPSKMMKQHFHDEVEIVIPLNGYFISYCQGEKQTIDTYNIFCSNSSTIHYLEFPQEYPEGIEIITILLSYDILKEYCSNIENYSFIINQDKIDIFIDIIKKIDMVFLQKDKFYQIELHTLLYQLCTLLLKYCLVEKQDNISYVNYLPITKEVINYIDQHYQEEITLPILAKKLGFSSVYLSRYFKEACGQTITSYIQKVRLQHSYDDLVNTNISITEIALDNGFANVKSFIEIFKREYQITPAKYRTIQKLNNDKN